VKLVETWKRVVHAGWTWGLKRLYVSARLAVEHRGDLMRIGSRYGGWVIPADLISTNSICYSAGVGQDISFDVGLIQRFGCTVHAFDPTPPAKEYIERYSGLDSRFVFHEYGVWSGEGMIPFYVPANPAFDNYSAVNLYNTAKYSLFPVRSISSIMAELGHDRIDLLKLDIEGAEYEVLDSILDDRLLQIRVICVEFDQPAPVRETIRMADQLNLAGYDLVSIEGWNMTFVLGA
jgi:FkbM family methyltransferase